MILIQETFVSEEVLEQHFLCNLKACKGACCWEGEVGAPLEKQELDILENIFEKIKPFLTEEGIQKIEEKGHYTYFKETKDFGTTLLENGACAYMTRDELGIAHCGIEQAYNAGVVDFKKPISCHLYPIRIKKNPQMGMELLAYDVWNICSAACSLGKQEQLPLFRFVKEAIIRKYGEEFYEEMEAAAKHLQQKTS